MDKKPIQSPTPWEVEKHSDEDIRIVGKNVTIAENFTEADAAFIVRAVNQHEALKAELEQLKKLDPSDRHQLEQYKEFRKMRSERDKYKNELQALLDRFAERTALIPDLQAEIHDLQDDNKAIRAAYAWAKDELCLLRTIAILAKDIYAWCECKRPEECCAWCNLVGSIKEWEGHYPNSKQEA